MRLAIMQPYFFPYIGYFQLIAAVDKILILDDVNYIKGGWINRNRILVDGVPKWITVPLESASPNKLICETFITADGLWKDSMLNAFDAAYRGAPFSGQARELLLNVLSSIDLCLSPFLVHAVATICSILGIETQIVRTSLLYPKGNLRGAQRIIDICLREQASEYVNLPGGRELYAPALFESHGVNLRFLRPEISEYPQGGCQFTPCLSILDMFARLDLAEMRHQSSLFELES